MAGVKGTGGSVRRERAPGGASARRRAAGSGGEGCPAAGEAVAGGPGGVAGASRPALCRCSSRGAVVQRSHRADVPHAGLRPGVLRVSGPSPSQSLFCLKAVN